jgi:hypothetical protein
LKLESLYHTFIDMGYEDMEFVRDELNEETLEEMGVDDTADGWSRTRLLDAVGKLKRGEGEG